MKKFLAFLLVALFAFSVAACEPAADDPECNADQDLVDGECVDKEEDTTAPTFSGVEDVTVYKDGNFDILDGVTATDDVDGDVTADITVAGTVDISTSGTYFVRYSVEDSAGNKREETRYITVQIDPSLVGDDMVPNGDFSLGWDIWTTTTGLEGGTANYEVVDGELVVEVTGVSGGLWEPRLENRGITFENGKTYEVSFDARALAPRAIHLQVGEILDAAPWFTNFKPGQTEIFDLSTEMESYSFTFTMGLATNANGSLIFEMGTVPANDLTENNLLTTVYLDNVSIVEAEAGADSAPPVITGAGPALIDAGTEFDLLEGISVLDNVDGEMTLTSANVEGYVDVNTPFEYRLIYRVSDSAGNETILIRLVTVREPLGNDSTGTTWGWRSFTNNWEGTAGELVAVDGEMVFDITAINAMTDNWKLQVIQDAFALEEGADNDGSMQFEAGKTYKVTFDARATVAGDVNLAIGHAVGGWTPYYTELISITTEMATYTTTFTLDAEGDYSTLAQFKLEMGLLFAGQTSGQFILDNVMIEVQEGEEFADADLLVNGDFDGPNLIEGWRSFTNNWEGTVGELVGVDGELLFDITAINAMTDNWKLQVIQDAFALGTGPDNAGSMQFEAGKTYKVTFDASASVAGDINLAIGHAVGGWTPYYTEMISITTEMATYTTTFTLDAEGDYATLAQFKFEMGLLFAGQTSGQFRLDNVMIEEQDGEAFVATDLVFNGDFDGPNLTEGWRAFTNNWEGTVGALVAADDQLVFDITAINAMTDNWKLQVIQDAFALGTGPDNAGSIQFEAGKTYRVTFDASASVAGDINLAIGHAGGGWTEYYSELISITTEMATYSTTFTLDAEGDYATLAQFKLEMGLLFAGQTSGQFMLDNVKIEVQEGEEFVSTDMIVNGHFEYRE
jgi:hypothetical protein